MSALRKHTNYAIPRGIVSVTAILNGLLGAGWAVLVFRDTDQAAIGYALALFVVLFWALIYSIGQAFFDMADNAIRRTVQGDQQAMAALNRPMP